MLWFHQARIDWTCKLMAWAERTGRTELFEKLRLHVHGLLDKQLARRAKARIPVIESYVEWGGGEVKND